MQPSANVLEMIERLIGFDTTSRNSNLELIAWVQNYLDNLGIGSELVHDETGHKANLYATLGPLDIPGIALSGHTDVVPVDGQPWDSDPFTVTRRDDRLYARGTCDMKSFIAICLALAPEFLERKIRIPLHFAFSYDEEVGCLGVRGLLQKLADRPVKPLACIIGEPTSMKVISGHKGKLSMRCHVHGKEAHSSLINQGVNAVEAAAEAIAYLKSMARRHRDQGPYNEDYNPHYTSVHTGTVHGGTALNIVPLGCSFEYEFRHLPGDDPEALQSELTAHIENNIVPEMKAVDPNSGFEFEPMSRIPGFHVEEDAEITQLAKSLSGTNSTGKVSFGTEAGLFQTMAGIPSVICGPGSIDQAHKPNEYIDIEQVARGEEFIRKLIEHCSD